MPNSNQNKTREELTFELQKLQQKYDLLESLRSKDISDRKLGEIMLKDEKELLRTIIELVVNPIFLKDNNHRIIFANQAFFDLFGLDESSVIGKTLAEKVPKNEMEHFLKIDRTVLDTGIPNCVEEELTVGDKLHTVITSKTRFLDKLGNKFLIGSIYDITDHKQSEEALRKSEEKLASFFEDDISADFLSTPDGKIIFCNKTFIKLFGFASKDEAMEYPIEKLYLSSSDREEYLALLKKNGKVENYECEYLTKDGRIINGLINSTGEFDQSGELIRFRGYIVDVTEIKIAEESLRKLSQTVEQSPVSIIITDTKGNIEYINPKTLEITGYKAEELIGENTNIFNSGETQKEEYKLLWETVSSGKVWHGEFHNKKKNGTLYWELASISPIFNKKGDIINYLAIKEDITDRKQKEAELVIANKELAFQNEEKEKRATELVIANKELGFQNEEKEKRAAELIIANKELAFQNEMKEKRATELVIANKELAFQNEEKGKRAAELIIANKELAYQNNEKAKRAEELMIANKELAFQNEMKEKRAIELVIANKELAFQNEEKEKRASELIIAKERAEESDRLKSAFLANMSHEIRTPMNGILGFAGLLKEPGLTGEKQQKYIEVIEKSGDRMLNIINNIVDISKIESGLMEIYIKETDINEKLENLYNFFKPEAEAKNIQLTIKRILPQKEAIIKTDDEKVYAILTNLIKNAIKYTNNGSIEFGVGYASSPTEKTELEFFIKDTGIGIPKDRQKVIFERFIQSDISDKMAMQGAGLGLSISKAYVEMLGGKIWAESDEFIGSTFYFTIPCNRYPKKKIPLQNNLASKKADNEVRNKKILIVDDDESSEMFLSLILEELSSEIFVAKNGIEAVEICRKNPDLDLILMDIQMPEMNGYEATQQIRQFNKEVIIIAQTAYGFSSDREKTIKAGCNEYIAKPIKIDELITLIQKYFN